MSNINRRKFVATAATITAGTMISATPFNILERKKVLAHQVYFWLKNPESETDRNQLIAGLKKLAKIDTVKKLYVSEVAATGKRSVIDDTWSISELVLFSDLEGERIYQSHPIHQDFIKTNSHLWSKVVVYDAIEI